LTVALGNGPTPLAVEGQRHRGLCFQQPGNFRFQGSRGDRRREAAYEVLQGTTAAARNAELDFVTRTAAAANASSQRVRKLAEKRLGNARYPATPLGRSLETVAALIAGGLPTRVYYVIHGGFDTHANQRGRHDRLMQQLNDGIVAFQQDLTAQKNADRVLTMAFSEFGRRAEENGSGGTDHGTAGPMFLFGPRVKAGLHGPPANLTDLDRGNLKFAIDFRGVYASVLARHLGMEPKSVLGEEFTPVDCITGDSRPASPSGKAS
jgi:uncharacterized protein (DUF1501 family)